MRFDSCGNDNGNGHHNNVILLTNGSEKSALLHLSRSHCKLKDRRSIQPNIFSIFSIFLFKIDIRCFLHSRNPFLGYPQSSYDSSILTQHRLIFAISNWDSIKTNEHCDVCGETRKGSLWILWWIFIDGRSSYECRTTRRSDNHRAWCINALALKLGA